MISRPCRRTCNIRGMSRWVAAAGALLVSLDSMMNIAFPAIAAAFAVPPERVGSTPRRFSSA